MAPNFFAKEVIIVVMEPEVFREIIQLVVQGKDCFDRGDLEGALEFYEAAIVQHPESAEAWLRKGMVLLDKGDYSAALDCCERALEFSQYDCAWVFKNSEFLTWSIKVDSLEKLQRYSDALEALDHALQITPPEPIIPISLLQETKGRLLELSNSYREATESYFEAVKLYLAEQDWRNADRCTTLGCFTALDRSFKAFATMAENDTPSNPTKINISRGEVKIPRDYIDRAEELWKTASNGRFGYERQLAIWKDLQKKQPSSTSEARTIATFLETLGWWKNLQFCLPTFDISAPPGALPTTLRTLSTSFAISGVQGVEQTLIFIDEFKRCLENRKKLSYSQQSTALKPNSAGLKMFSESVENPSKNSWQDAVTLGVLVGGAALIGIILFLKSPLRSSFSSNPANSSNSNTSQSSQSAPAPAPSQSQSGNLTLTKQDAANLIERWLRAKRQIFSSPFDRQLANEVTTGLLYQDITKRNGSIDWLKQNNAYYQFGIQKIGDVESFSVNGDRATIDIAVTEDRTLYVNSKVDSEQTSYDTRIVRYTLEISNGAWKIADYKTVKIIN